MKKSYGSKNARRGVHILIAYLYAEYKIQFAAATYQNRSHMNADLNIYRICINADDTCESLLVNKTDLGYFRWIFDALDGLKTSWLSKHE